MGLTNSDCTIYSRNRDPSNDYDTWTRIYIPECWWFLKRKSNLTNGGMEDNSELTVRIFDLSVSVGIGDYIVKGECPVDMVTVKDLKPYEYFKVTLSNYNDFGDNQHIKVVAN